LPTVDRRSNTLDPMPPKSRCALLALVLLLPGCAAVQNFSLRPYRMNVQQGNFLETRDIDQIQVGMTQSQVRFLIGTPMVADPFNANRWDYVFFFKVGRTRNEVTSHVTIWFEDDRVVRIDRPMELEDTIPEDIGFDA
jgi:outer membrane protein assembly factor BamE